MLSSRIHLLLLSLPVSVCLCLSLFSPPLHLSASSLLPTQVRSLQLDALGLEVRVDVAVQVRLVRVRPYVQAHVAVPAVVPVPVRLRVCEGRLPASEVAVSAPAAFSRAGYVGVGVGVFVVAGAVEAYSVAGVLDVVVDFYVSGFHAVAIAVAIVGVGVAGSVGLAAPAAVPVPVRQGRAVARLVALQCCRCVVLFVYVLKS
jgi:hypothetical protein